jgi:hypothetical protein
MTLLEIIENIELKITVALGSVSIHFPLQSIGGMLAQHHQYLPLNKVLAFASTHRQ